MKNIFFILAILFIVSCNKLNNNDRDSDIPAQTIVTRDSSDQTGRLYVEFYNTNGNSIDDAKASLYVSYDDMKKGIPLYTFNSNTFGRVDFGFVLIGNYYITGMNNVGNLHDTTVTQILPQRTITRKLILR